MMGAPACALGVAKQSVCLSDRPAVYLSLSRPTSRVSALYPLPLPPLPINPPLCFSLYLSQHLGAAKQTLARTRETTCLQLPATLAFELQTLPCQSSSDPKSVGQAPGISLAASPAKICWSAAQETPTWASLSPCCIVEA